MPMIDLTLPAGALQPSVLTTPVIRVTLPSSRMIV